MPPANGHVERVLQSAANRVIATWKPRDCPRETSMMSRLGSSAPSSTKRPTVSGNVSAYRVPTYVPYE